MSMPQEAGAGCRRIPRLPEPILVANPNVRVPVNQKSINKQRAPPRGKLPPLMIQADNRNTAIIGGVLGGGGGGGGENAFGAPMPTPRGGARRVLTKRTGATGLFQGNNE